MLSLCWKNIRVKPRHNNIYYTTCCYHKTTGTQIRINDNRKRFYCFGCSDYGSFLLIASDYLNVDYTENTDSILNVFYAFIKKDIGSLNKMELTWYKEIFKNYDIDLINYYHDISFQKKVEIN